jgi:serine/threonine protein kinase
MSITDKIDLEHEYLIAEQNLSAIDNYYYHWQIERFTGFNDSAITILAINNLLLKNFIVIGWGSGGGALKRVGQDIIVKIGKSDVISKELNIIKAFNEIILTPDELSNNKKLPFVKYEDLLIEEYDTATLYAKFPEVFDMDYVEHGNFKYLSYSMPFLGKDFMEFFCCKYSYNHFTRFWCSWEKPSSYYGIETIRVTELQMYTSAWMKLNDNIKTLHNHNFTHGDIKGNNMIYKVESNEFILIDFDQSINLNKITEVEVENYRKKNSIKNLTIDEYKDILKIDDMIDCIIVFFTFFIYYSFGNLYIYEELYKNRNLLIHKNGQRRDKQFVKTWEYIDNFIKDLNTFVMNLDKNEKTIRVPNGTFTDTFNNSDKDLRIVPDVIRRKIELSSKVRRKSKASRLDFFNIDGGKKRSLYTFSIPKSKGVKSKKRYNKYYTRKNIK